MPEEFGGQGLPYVLHSAVSEYLISANMALMMYPGLTQGAIAAILEHGSDAQKQTYVPNMIAGTWTGTMNLTEPHCGTDLGLLRTKAVPQGDGSYKISGQKIFISAGEHDMSENIIHLVLARIEARRKARRAFRSSSCRSSSSRKTARSAPATVSPAARLSTRWASMVTPPAS